MRFTLWLLLYPSTRKTNRTLLLYWRHLWRLGPLQSRGTGRLALFVSGNMVEAGAKEVPEQDMLEALAFAQKEIDKIEDFQKKIISEIGKEKIMPELKKEPEKISEIFEKDFREKLEKAIYVKDKKERNSGLFSLKEDWDKAITESVGPAYSGVADGFYEGKIDEIVHKNILESDLRPDGRGLKELRPIWAGVGIAPRTHGSGLFQLR